MREFGPPTTWTMKSPLSNICLLQTGGFRYSRLSSIQSSSLNGIVVFIGQGPSAVAVAAVSRAPHYAASQAASARQFRSRAPRGARNPPVPASRAAPWDRCRPPAICSRRQPALQRAAERLAPHRKELCDEPCEPRVVLHRKRRSRVRHEPHDRGPNLRRRRERARSDVEACLRAHRERQHDGEAPVLLAAWRRGHALDDLALQHHVQILDDGCELEQMKQQRRRDVVGQVADDAQRARPGRESAEVELQRIGFVDDQPLGMRHAARQRGRELAIDLDDVQALEPLAERNRQRAGAAADFDHRVARQRSNNVDDPADDGRVVQKMLAEPFLGVHGVYTSCSASSTAANRLSGRARPVPASDNAVP